MLCWRAWTLYVENPGTDQLVQEVAESSLAVVAVVVVGVGRAAYGAHGDE